MREDGVPGAAADTGGGGRPEIPGVAGEGARGGRSGREGEEGHRNEVLLVGRITAEPVFRKTARGDRPAGWRMCVGRPAGQGVSGRRSDAIYCVGFDPGLHPRVGEWRSGGAVRVTGRRVWHGRADVRSMYEVEARTVALVRRARPGTGDAPAVPCPRPAPPEAGR
ncbi:hypothetical protein SUDANB121_05067 [Nocardiopsis dassonvillei]|uniref:single-stranded DNA-binding protein n=1 Tax=Nocardiopsis dassonvillei TaxID=2014 RepID=UPI003F556E59